MNLTVRPLAIFACMACSTEWYIYFHIYYIIYMCFMLFSLIVTFYTIADLIIGCVQSCGWSNMTNKVNILTIEESSSVLSCSNDSMYYGDCDSGLSELYIWQKPLPPLVVAKNVFCYSTHHTVKNLGLRLPCDCNIKIPCKTIMVQINQLRTVSE